MKIQIRRADVADVPTLEAFQRESWYTDYVDYIPDGYADHAMQIYGTTEQLTQQVETSKFYFVAQIDDSIVGCVTAAVLNDNEAEIWWVHVAGSHRGQRIGRQLIDHLIASLPDYIAAVYVTTFKDYTPTLTFYERLGFVHHSDHTYDAAGFKLNDVRLRLDIRRG